MALDIRSIGQTATQVSDTVKAMTTSSRLYTQPVPVAGDTLTASTTAEQPFASSYTIPANSLTLNQSIRVTGWGIYTTPALSVVTQRARLKAGTATLVDSGPQLFPVSLSALRYKFTLDLMVRAIGVNGSIEAMGELVFATSITAAITVLSGPSGAASDAGNPVTTDTTQPIPLTLTCTFGAALAGNSNSLRQMAVSTLRPPAL